MRNDSFIRGFVLLFIFGIFISLAYSSESTCEETSFLLLGKF